MAKRITIMLDDDLLKKLHEMQAKLIKESSKSVSFSRVLNQTIRKNLKWQFSSFPKNNLFFKLLLLWKLLWTTWINPGRLVELGVARQFALVTTFVLSRHDFVVLEGFTLIMSEQHLKYSKLNLKLWLIHNSHPSQKIISN